MSSILRVVAHGRLRGGNPPDLLKNSYGITSFSRSGVGIYTVILGKPLYPPSCIVTVTPVWSSEDGQVSPDLTVASMGGVVAVYHVSDTAKTFVCGLASGAGGLVVASDDVDFDFKFEKFSHRSLEMDSD